ncbi:V-type ATP synthase subunit D [Candidatus Parvarchaeota archaeon]|nr:V-type ATP synthase subunit D [Candidatus Parvarchaeota archaeon]
MAENPNPTRMELLKAKARIVLAKKGHKLLKQKRDALVMEFFKILEKAKDMRSELNATLKDAYQTLAVAQIYHSVYELEAIASQIKKAPGVKIEVKNVMGVKIPSIQSVPVQKSPFGRGYSIIGSTAKVDEAADNFEKTTDMIVKLAETENALRKLIREIEKTKRRVNALEFILIPKLEAQAKLIRFRLEEMERDSFFVLKMMKKKLGKKARKQDN